MIGINTALISPTGGNVGIGFAIPAEQVAPIVEQLRRGQRVQRGYIGVALQTSTRASPRRSASSRNRGELIRSVTPGGPADRAGIRQGDVVISVAGQPVTPDQTLAYLVSRQPIGARIPIELIRQGRRADGHRRGRRAADRRGAGPAQRHRATTTTAMTATMPAASRAPSPVGRPACDPVRRSAWRCRR